MLTIVLSLQESTSTYVPRALSATVFKHTPSTVNVPLPFLRRITADIRSDWLSSVKESWARKAKVPPVQIEQVDGCSLDPRLWVVALEKTHAFFGGFDQTEPRNSTSTEYYSSNTGHWARWLSRVRWEWCPLEPGTNYWIVLHAVSGYIGSFKVNHY